MADSLPSKVGKYEVRSALGEGGFGRVYKAYDPTVGRPVAIKVLTAQGSPDMLARFQNEASAAGNLHHENIVTIYEFGVYEGAPYIAMEYLEGSDLNQIMSSGQPLSLLDKVRIMSQVGHGLQCAHDHGVIHRDVKPANIKVLPNRAVKMMDFGIARLTGNDSTRLTQKGDLVGTIRYMSPEQFAGLDVDALCDIFAYGVIFYELVTGVHPFEAPDVASFMYRITEAQPAPLSRVVPGCPPALQEIVMRALEKDRDLRYQSLEDLLLDMRPLLLELQKERADELFRLAQDLYNSGQVQRAQPLIREIIDLDSSNPEVWELRERVNQSIHRQSVRPKVDNLLKAADNDLGRRLFPEAIESLEAAVKLDPTDTGIARKLADARLQWDGAIRAARLLSDASQELERQNLTLADRLAAEALSLDPNNKKVADFAGAVRNELERRENERRLKGVLDDARRLAAVEDFDAAIEKLASLQNLRDPTGQVPTLLSRIREQQFEHGRHERLRSEKQVLRGLLKESRLADALPRLEALCGEFPEDRDLEILLSDTRQQLSALQQAADVQNARSEASALQASGRFAEAEEVLRRLSGRYSGDSEILYMLQAATRLREDAERRQNLANAVRTVEQLRVESRFEEARRAVDAAAREFGDEGALADQRKKLDQEWTQHQRAERLRQAITAARARLAEGQPDSAITVLKQAAAEDPQNKEIDSLLREARSLAEVQRATRSIDQACAQARELAGAHDFDAAVSLLRRSLQSYPDDSRLMGLVDAISREKQEWESEQRLREAIRSSTQLIRERRYPEAVHALEQFLEKVPGEPAILKLLNQARADWEASKRSDALARACADIRAAIEQNRFDEAAMLIEHHSPEFGTRPPFIALRSQLEETARQAERNRRIAEAESQVRSLVNQGNREAALRVCQAAMAQDPDAPQLLELFSALQQQVAWDKRQAEVARLTGLARQAIVLKDWAGAAARIEELGRQYPDEPSLPSLRDALKAERLSAESEQAFVALDDTLYRRDWAKAEKQLAAAASRAPDSPRIADARGRIERGKRRDKTLVDARTALKKERFDDVERLLNPLLAEDAADSDASALLYEAQARRENVEADSAVRQSRKEAKSLAADRRFDQAARILQSLVDRYGRQPELERELEQYSAAAEVQKQVQRLQERFKAGDAQSVLEGATRILARADEPEARRLLEWAQSALIPVTPQPAPPVVERQAPPVRQPLAEPKPAVLRPPPDKPPERPFWRRPVVLGVAAAVILIALGAIARVLLSPAAPPLAVVVKSVPAGKVGQAYSGELTATGGVAPYRWSISSKTLPPGLTLAPGAGTIDGVPIEDGRFDFSIRATDKSGHTVETALNVSVEPKAPGTVTAPVNPPAPALNVETSSLPEGKAGGPYEFSLAASGGTPPYQWALENLPRDLALEGGTIRGKPAREGTFDIRARVNDAAGKTAKRTLRLTVKSAAAPVPPLRILTSSLPEGKVNSPYTGTLAASGGRPPYSWAALRGLPAGLRLSPAGSIDGAPSAEGKSSLSIRLTDAENHSMEATLSLVVAGVPVLVTTPNVPHCPPSTAQPITKETYGYDQEGTIEWRGTPVAGKPVLVSGKSATSGSISRASAELGGAPVKLDLSAGSIVEPPSRQNGWSCFVFQPAQNSVKIGWKVDWTLK